MRTDSHGLIKIKAVMLGHAVADALGVPVEFSSRAELDCDPVVDMRGWGAYNVPEGCWSDDTSMSLATLDALARDGLNYESIMNNFAGWLDDGDYTPTGAVFDVGGTCHAAIRNYTRDKSKSPLECGLDGEYSNGNGSLMRIHPFVLYAYTRGLSPDSLIEIINNGSSLTHRHEKSKLACLIYAFVLYNLLNEQSKESVERSLNKANGYFTGVADMLCFDRIFDKNFSALPREQIKGSGYVVDTLEAAIWCLLTTNDYKSCVLKAVNLGDDTDTVAAVAGGLAGALYGYDSIPNEWLRVLKKRRYIESLCETAFKKWQV